MLKNAVRIVLLLSAFAVGLAVRPPTASAAVYADGVSPVYLVVSAPAEDFDVTSVPDGELASAGSQTIVVKIGTFIGGQGLLDTRFATNRLTNIPLPDGLNFRDLDHNQVTILGGVLVQGTTQIHMLCPSPDPIAGAIQIAFYNASRDGVLDNLVAPVEGVPQFPTTYAIAAAVAEYLPPPPEGATQLTVNEVEAGLFATPDRLKLSDTGTLAVVSEGELFPHDPGNKIFDFVLSFDEDSNFNSDVCYSVQLVVKPNSSVKPINRNAKGKLPVAILSTDEFDATTFLDADIQIAGVSPSHVAIQDVNDDGLDDLVCQFSIPSLKSAGALDVDDTELLLEAVLDDENGSCIKGTDSIQVLSN